MAGGSPDGTWSVVVVDDSDSFSMLIRLWFRRDGRFSVIGTAREGAEAVAMASKLQPAVVVLDDAMPGMSGLEAIRTIRECSPSTKVVVYSVAVNEDRVQLASILGADAVVSKLNPIRSLVSAAAELLRPTEP